MSLRERSWGYTGSGSTANRAASFPLYSCSGSHDSERRYLHQHARSEQRYGYSHRPRTVIMLGDITQAKNVWISRESTIN